MNINATKTVLAAGLAILAIPAVAQTYSIDTFTVAGGSDTLSGGAYTISGTVGQPDGNLELSGGGFSMDGGFWSIVDAEPPAVMATTIFDNTGAGYNGFEAATTNNWLATKICLGAQSYSLVSVTLPLASGDNGGAQVRTVQLQIFANDPATGKPSTSTGAIMNLSGATNPITLGVGYTETPFTWMPATPLTLAANTCYWVVLSTGIGNAGQIDVASAATGDAATFGRTVSPDAGTTWQPPDNSTSRKMLIQATPISTPSPITIFDNTGGFEVGGEGARTNVWLANKYCLGPQAYQLDSVSLLLNSQNGNGTPGPPSSVRLQIYANDPVSDKPSTSTGLIMNLSGMTNPITLMGGQQLVRWTPDTTLTLAANTCYWVVLSTDDGVIGELDSYTMPTGDAAAFGRGVSPDAGGTWGVYDTVSNRKMLIQAIPEGSPLPGAELAAGGSTAIPGGTGNFTSLPLAPGLSGSNLVFYGAGSSGQQGIYSTTRGLNQTPTRIADLSTAIPNGAGNFLSFGTEAGIIIVGGDILFSGLGSGSQQGIYLSSHASPGALLRIADTAMAIPSGAGTFTGFQNALGFSGTGVAFAGNGSGGQAGIYTVSVLAPPQVGSPLRLVDTTTAIPSGAGNFTGFPSGPALSGSEAAFIANGSGTQQGLYTVAVLAPPQVGSPLRIADTATPIPGGTGDFTSFGSDQAHPIDPAINGDRLAFVGSGSGGQQGIYGASVAVIGPPYKIADTTTPIPGGSGTFASFGAVSVSATDLAFLGHGAGGQTGIYDATGGQLSKVISVGDALQGKTIAGLNFSRGGLFGDPIAFQATFKDGSQGVYTIDVPTPLAELRIIAVDQSGADLRLSFTSVAGTNYVIQSSADLSLSTWTTLLGAPTPGTGGTVAVTLPNALGQPQQFYRVKMVP